MAAVTAGTVSGVFLATVIATTAGLVVVAARFNVRRDPLFELLNLEARLLRFGRLLLFCLRFHDEISFRFRD